MSLLNQINAKLPQGMQSRRLDGCAGVVRPRRLSDTRGGGRVESRRSLGNLSLLGLLLLHVLGEELLVLSSALLGVLEAVLSLLLDGALSAEALLGDQTLDLGGLEESLVSALDLTAHNVLAHIVLLLVEGKGLDDVVAALHAETVGALNVGHTLDLLVALLHDSQEESSNVGADDAATAGLAGTLTGAHGLVASAAYTESV